LTNQENVPIKATGLSRLATGNAWSWQRSDDGGQTWTTITANLDAGVTYSNFSGTGGTTSTLIISKADPRIHGFQYRLRLIGTNNSSGIETNPSVLTVADVFGVCATGSLPIQLISSSTAKTDLTTLTNAAFVSDNTKLNDGNTQTGMVVTNSTRENITSSLSFDGSDDHVTFGQPAAIQAITSGITVEAWVYPRTFGGDWFVNPVVEKQDHFGLRIGSKFEQVYNPMQSYDYSTNEYVGGYDNIPVGGSVAFTVANSSKNWSMITDGGTISANTWSHLAATYDSNSKIIIVVFEKFAIIVEVE
jgi:hypothetical protein